jgi:hypothetical protein
VPPAFVPNRFPARPKVDNRYLPLTPGSQLTVSGMVTGDDGKQHAHRIVTTVTDLTKVLGRVRTVVVLDEDFEDNKLQESELAFFAQDVAGNVWTVGEYPELWGNGKLTGAPSTWIAGLTDAKPGYAMTANPRLGAPAYLQGLVPSIGFEDCARVFKTGQQTCVTLRCFTGVLVTDEWAPRDPAGGHQRKFYAPGVGTVRIAAVGGTNPEVLQLTAATRLRGSAFAAVRAKALRQDTRGYTVSPRIYGRTPHASRTYR